MSVKAASTPCISGSEVSDKTNPNDIWYSTVWSRRLGLHWRVAIQGYRGEGHTKKLKLDEAMEDVEEDVNVKENKEACGGEKIEGNIGEMTL